MKDTNHTNNPTGQIGETSEREVLNKITQPTRFAIVQNILMHPKRMPSLEELNYANPGKSRATIREHVQKLIEIGVVREVTLPEEEVQRDLPRKFYTLSAGGEEIMHKFNLVNLEGTLGYLYENMDKTEKIEKYESAPRPDIENRAQKVRN